MRKEHYSRSDQPFLNHPAYKHLRKSISEDVAPLVVIVGSGLSRSDGYPDWKGLRATLEQSLRDKRLAELDTDADFDTEEIDTTLERSDYWDFFRDSKNCLTPPTYRQIIRDALGPLRNGIKSAQPSEGRSLRSILRLNPRGLVTLNLDPIAGNIFSEKTRDLWLFPFMVSILIRNGI